MIVYSATKKEFCADVRSNEIATILYDKTLQKLGKKTGESEVRSWRNSLQFMNNILFDSEIPNDSLVALEYKIPGTSNRIDFIISGQDENKKDSAIIVELKQWSNADKTELDGLVLADYGKSQREVPHPSYQAWSYAAHLADYNSSVQDHDIQLVPCAYLHNCLDRTNLDNEFYKTYTDSAPIFFQDDTAKLTAFIKKYVKYGDKDGVLYKIENGKIRPSKNLADQLSSMLQGNQEFILIDDQKVVFEKAVNLAKTSSAKNKNVLIVEGGPGSGKSVVAINLLAKFTELGLTSQYVTKNSAPRAVFEQKLTGTFTKSRISGMFKGSGSYVDAEKNCFDTLIIDEAHRLNEKSGMFSHLGENQVLEIIRGSTFSVFFIDENQKVTYKDIGTKDEIRKWAKKEKANVVELSLNSQFRCNGSDGYIAWLDNSLQIKDTANEALETHVYDFKVLDDPKELRDQIYAKNKINNKSRLVAGYCWKWPSKKDPKAYDIVIDDFKMKWNLTTYGISWIIQPNSVSEVGCIHTCQGLELDYVGVIIGPDLLVRDGVVITDASKRASSDQSVKGFKSRLKANRAQALKEADVIIKNTYRTLMTRGMKGCYVYCTDQETREYFKRTLRNV